MTQNYQEGKDYSQKVVEKTEIKINWMGVLKYTVIAGVVAGAYVYGKKVGAKQEAMKHVAAEPVETTTVETPEI